jgi:predicted RecA/RadA family phage recombinase
MSQTFKQSGKLVPYYSAAGVAVDAVVALPGRLGVVQATIAALGTGTVSISGVHNLPATTADAWEDGDPLFWDLSTTKLTRLGTPATPFAGTAVGAKVATTQTRADVLLNERGNTPVCMLHRTWEDCAGNLTLDAEDVGKVINVTADAKTITLPATAAGLEFIIRNGGADGAVLVNIDPQDADKIMSADWAGVDKKSALNTKATARRGDFARLVGGNTDGYFIVERRGIWAAEA